MPTTGVEPHVQIEKWYICKVCEENKPASSFYIKKQKKRNNQTFRVNTCSECLNKSRKLYAVDLSVNKKSCSKCGIEKDISDFEKNKKNLDGYNGVCRKCDYKKRKNRPDEAKRRSESGKKTYYKNRARIFARKMGVSEAECLVVLAQYSSCVICGGQNKTRALAIDHNHQTGKVRGLLCGKCNSALGLLREDIGIMYKMIAYVLNHNK